MIQQTGIPAVHTAQGATIRLFGSSHGLNYAEESMYLHFKWSLHPYSKGRHADTFLFYLPTILCLHPSAMEMNGISFVVPTALKYNNFKESTPTSLSRNRVLVSLWNTRCE